MGINLGWDYTRMTELKSSYPECLACRSKKSNKRYRVSLELWEPHLFSVGIAQENSAPLTFFELLDELPTLARYSVSG